MQEYLGSGFGCDRAEQHLYRSGPASSVPVALLGTVSFHHVHIQREEIDEALKKVFSLPWPCFRVDLDREYNERTASGQARTRRSIMSGPTLVLRINLYHYDVSYISLIFQMSEFQNKIYTFFIQQTSKINCYFVIYYLLLYHNVIKKVYHCLTIETITNC